jgi:hypothetical protein
MAASTSQTLDSAAAAVAGSSPNAIVRDSEATRPKRFAHTATIPMRPNGRSVGIGCRTCPKRRSPATRHTGRSTPAARSLP